MIRDSYRGFLAIDNETILRVKVSWARILVKLEGKARPSIVNILEGVRSFELQIWWGIPPKSIEVYPSKAGKKLPQKQEEREEEGEASTRTGKHMWSSLKAQNDEGHTDGMGETVDCLCRVRGSKESSQVESWTHTLRKGSVWHGSSSSYGQACSKPKSPNGSRAISEIMEKEVYFGLGSSKSLKNSSLGVGQRSRGPLVLKTTQVGLNAQMKSHKGTSSSLLKERNSNPRAPVRH